MYTDGAQTTGHYRFIQQNSTATAGPPAPCPCPHCARYEPGSHRQPDQDHPSPDPRRDLRAWRVKDVGGRALMVGRGGGHRSPQRRPVFGGPGPWELDPAQWTCPPEPGARHSSSVREPCSGGGGCVARPFNAGIPHPLPHLQVKGQGHRLRRTVRYVSVEEEEEENCGCTSESFRLELRNSQPGHFHTPNGHCGPRPVLFEGREERDTHQDRLRPAGGSEEAFNGCGGFFPTEVPQKHLSRWTGSCCGPPSGSLTGPDASGLDVDRPGPGSEVVKQRSGRRRQDQDSVRDQIRQVVTDLEDVLGGLKQVHNEMKEVVEQIDRLTAHIDLSEEAHRLTQGASHHSTSAGDLHLAPSSSHRPPQPPAEDRIILTTNCPSPVHMASVVKTRRFTPPSLHRDVAHDRPGANGHPPQLHPLRHSNHVAPTGPDPHPQTLDPRIVGGSSTSNPRTQKPPPYPQNGRCGKGPYAPSKPARGPAHPGRSPAHPGRSRQSTSMV